ncbi:hypothetical protein [uncultured Rubinisphaera sp.]|uniref:hypothetical protein n=1 Tax=uncultured Rubinisphaera sp. TaxID=1678686 RepID=UPI0030D7E468
MSSAPQDPGSRRDGEQWAEVRTFLRRPSKLLAEDLHANVTRNHRRETMRELMKDVRGWLKKRNHHAKQHNSYQPL